MLIRHWKRVVFATLMILVGVSGVLMAAGLQPTGTGVNVTLNGAAVTPAINGAEGGVLTSHGSSALPTFDPVPPNFTPGGDLDGSAATQYVVGIQGRTMSSTAPTNGQAIVWDGSTWGPASLPVGFTAGGDLSGTSTSQTVIALQGRSVSSSAPSSANILVWSGSAWAPVALSGGCTVTTAGVLTCPQAGDIDGSTGAAVVVSATGQGADTFGSGGTKLGITANEIRFGPDGGGIHFNNETAITTDTTTAQTVSTFTPPNSSNMSVQLDCTGGAYPNDGGTGANGDVTNFSLTLGVTVAQPGGVITLISQNGMARATTSVTLLAENPFGSLDGSAVSTTGASAQAILDAGVARIQLFGPNTDAYHFRCNVQRVQQTQ